MSKAQDTIEQATRDLAAAKKYKSNQMEYDALAQIIMKHKDRQSTQVIFYSKLEDEQIFEID